MTTATLPVPLPPARPAVTPDDLLKMGQQGLFELVDGELVEKPVGALSGETATIHLQHAVFVHPGPRARQAVLRDDLPVLPEQPQPGPPAGPGVRRGRPAQPGARCRARAGPAGLGHRGRLARRRRVRPRRQAPRLPGRRHPAGLGVQPGPRHPPGPRPPARPADRRVDGRRHARGGRRAAGVLDPRRRPVHRR